MGKKIIVPCLDVIMIAFLPRKTYISDSVHFDSWMLTDESTVLRGFVTLSSEDNEEAIRKAMSDAIQMK